MFTHRTPAHLPLALRRSALGLSAAVLVALAGCPADKAEDPKPATDKPADKPADGEKPADKPATNTAAAEQRTSHPDCVGQLADAPKESFKAGELEIERAGAVVTVKTEDPDDEFILGQLTDVKDYTPENAANLKLAVKWFQEQKIDALAVTGDLGESVESITKVLGELAPLGVPILAIAGNRECRVHFTEAVDAVHKQHPHVINMNKVRVFNVDDVSVVSLPGYYNRSYIHCAEGCEYFPADVQNLSKFAAKATAPAKVLISHGPPKMKGETGLDRIHEEVNVGDPELAKFLESGAFPFGMFGNIQEAGGYATDITGTKRIDQDAFVDRLYMNPGPIDAVRWAMLDGTESMGMAGVLHVKGKQAKYRIYRIRPGDLKKGG